MTTPEEFAEMMRNIPKLLMKEECHGIKKIVTGLLMSICVIC